MQHFQHFFAQIFHRAAHFSLRNDILLSVTTLRLTCRRARYTAAAKLSDVPTATCRVYVTISRAADVEPSEFTGVSPCGSEMQDLCVSAHPNMSPLSCRTKQIVLLRGPEAAVLEPPR